MKRIFSLSLCILLLLSLSINASAETNNSGTVIFREETLLENGLLVVDEIIEYAQTRIATKSYTRQQSFYYKDNLIAVIAFTAKFYYDGIDVSVISKSVTQTDTYNNWNYTQNSFTSSGGTVTLTGKLTKLLIFNASISMGLACDANGNITIF